MIQSFLPIVLVGMLLSSLWSPALLQVPGIAEISSPQEGEILVGSVTIHGTAAHPSFVEYELAFGYNRDQTETWFPIGETVTNPVQDGRLALWDTTGIADGEYRLRLTVWSEQGEPLRAIVEGLRISNYTQAATVTPSEPDQRLPTSTSQATTSPPTITPTTVLPVTSGPNIGGSLVVGAILGITLLLGLTLYVRLRGDLRARFAALRTRRFHRRLDRDRKRGSS